MRCSRCRAAGRGWPIDSIQHSAVKHSVPYFLGPTTKTFETRRNRGSGGEEGAIECLRANRFVSVLIRSSHSAGFPPLIFLELRFLIISLIEFLLKHRVGRGEAGDYFFGPLKVLALAFQAP